MKALNDWFRRIFERCLRSWSCNYEDNYYGDQLCKCDKQS